LVQGRRLRQRRECERQRDDREPHDKIMEFWAGYLGNGNPDLLRRLLGKDATVRAGAGFALGAAFPQNGSETLTATEEGVLTVRLGADHRAGCSATFAPGTGTLTLTCDPFGLHGICTAEYNGAFWFASDMRVLHSLLGVSARLDPVALHGYLCFSYVP